MAYLELHTFQLEVEDEFLAADFLVNAVFEFVWLEGFILRASSLQLQKPRKTDSGKRPSMGGSNSFVAWPRLFDMASTSTSWPLKLSALLFSTEWTTAPNSSLCIRPT